jgi:hypothetical protein
MKAAEDIASYLEEGIKLMKNHRDFKADLN